MPKGLAEMPGDTSHTSRGWVWGHGDVPTLPFIVVHACPLDSSSLDSGESDPQFLLFVIWCGVLRLFGVANILADIKPRPGGVKGTGTGGEASLIKQRYTTLQQRRLFVGRPGHDMTAVTGS